MILKKHHSSRNGDLKGISKTEITTLQKAETKYIFLEEKGHLPQQYESKLSKSEVVQLALQG